MSYGGGAASAAAARRLSALEGDLAEARREVSSERSRADKLQDEVWELRGLLKQSQENYDALLRAFSTGQPASAAGVAGAPAGAAAGAPPVTGLALAMGAGAGAATHSSLVQASLDALALHVRSPRRYDGGEDEGEPNFDDGGSDCGGAADGAPLHHDESPRRWRGAAPTSPPRNAAQRGRAGARSASPTRSPRAASRRRATGGSPLPLASTPGPPPLELAQPSAAVLRAVAHLRAGLEDQDPDSSYVAVPPHRVNPEVLTLARWENFQARTALLEVLHGRHEGGEGAGEGGEGGGDEGADEGGPEQDEGRAALPARGRSPPCTGGWGWTGLDSWGGRDDKAPPRQPSPPPPARWRGAQQPQQPDPPSQQAPAQAASRAPSREGSHAGSRPHSRATAERDAELATAAA